MKTILRLSFVALLLFAISWSPSQAAEGTFSWSASSASVQTGSTATIGLTLNTGGTNATGADAVLSFDPNTIEVTAVSFSTPNLFPQNFFTTDPSSGILRISSTYTDISSSYSGSGAFATVTIRGKKAGSTSLSWRCTPGATNDTNILVQGSGDDVVSCGLPTLAITVSDAVTSTQSTPPPSQNQPATSQSTNQSTNQSSSGNQDQGSTTCSSLRSTPTSLSAQAVSATSVKLSWRKDVNATNYTIAYGTTPGSFQFGATNIGNVSEFIVSYLNPNTTYYFSLSGVNACSSSGFISASTRTLGGNTSSSSPVARANVPIQSIAPTITPVDQTPSFATIVTQQATETQDFPEQSPMAVVQDETSPETLIASVPPSSTPELQQQSSIINPGRLVAIIVALLAFVVGAILIFFLRKKGQVSPTDIPPLTPLQ